MSDTEEVVNQKTQEEEEENTEEFTFDHTLKKKKTNKSKVTFKDDEQNDEEKEKNLENKKGSFLDNCNKDKAEEVVVDGGEVGDLSSTKKKRKKKTADLADFEKQLKEDDDEKSDEDIFAQEAEQNETEVKEIKEEWHDSNRDYTYQELLRRVFQILRQNNPELAGEKKRYTIVPPSVHRDGNKKTIFANVSDICKRMHRQPEHVIQFLFAELGTSGSIDGMQRLVIKGRFQQKQIENVLRRYIVEYVTCKTCKSPDTILTKENRIFFQQCESCGSTRSVSAIKTGFKAQTEKRAAQRRAVQ
ncbi:23277_t:CDS:2 [Entrophospora sp. SA101]|nr:11162_t:CDS:2 [Entrophospora sp. SA101]CAJ0757042.1 23273_t:CDS:2 [Entrophospora sp. SA101]CAJ0757046.1 23277_t:CDS:2 [Entrophospora sp. SA101]CAJ0836340.1 16045_t:CDS:2 [Entrophospora sp. SA101]